MLPVIEFPAYRKYRNNRHFFKIKSQHEFDELTFIGQKAFVTTHTAKILPDRNFINDLLYDVGNTAELCTEQEYESKLTLINKL